LRAYGLFHIGKRGFGITVQDLTTQAYQAEEHHIVSVSETE